MKDFIFLIGTSGIGKTTMGKGLFAHYNGAFVEQSMVPEFGIPENVGDEGVFEEQVCWEACVAQLIKFHEMGIKNIVGSDFDDLRTADIPVVFKGNNYITLKLICKDLSQLHDQMENRVNGLLDFELQRKCSDNVNKRPLLINEVEIDVTNKTAHQVLEEALDILIPQQAAGSRDIESLKAIYAAETMDEVIPFALPIRWYPDNPEGKRDFECRDGRILLKYGSLDLHGVGYVYKVRADYLERVEFSEEAEKIRRQMNHG